MCYISSTDYYTYSSVEHACPVSSICLRLDSYVRTERNFYIFPNCNVYPVIDANSFRRKITINL